MTGRWPANVILSTGMAEVLDEQSGISKTAPRGRPTNGIPQGGGSATNIGNSSRSSVHHGDEGGASRFFLTAGYEPWELEWIIANGLTPCGE